VTNWSTELSGIVFSFSRQSPRITVFIGDGLVSQTTVDSDGLQRGPGLPRPTPHSLRHTFAVRALEACPDDRDKITKHMLALSTYLGHSKVSSTYWYLEATPDLMRDISKCFENFTKGGQP
jgi:integrase